MAAGRKPIPTNGVSFPSEKKIVEIANGLVFLVESRPFFVDGQRLFRPTVEGMKGACYMPQPSLDPRPTDPPFLFVTLLAARKAGDELLETLSRGWLAEQGIVVRFANELPARVKPGKGAGRG